MCELREIKFDFRNNIIDTTQYHIISCMIALTLGAKTAPGVGRPGHGDNVVALFALAYGVVVHLCAYRVFVVQLTRVVLETLFPQPCNHERGRKSKSSSVRMYIMYKRRRFHPQ